MSAPLLPLLLILTACGPHGGDDTGQGCEAGTAVWVGGGEQRFEAVTPGDPRTMVHGPQGGWHILGSVRMAGFSDVVSIHYQIRADTYDGAMVSDNTYRVQSLPDPDAPGDQYYPGLYGYLDVSGIAQGELDTPPELLSYQPVTLSMAVTDTEGRCGQAQLGVQAVPDDQDLDMVPTSP